MTNMKRIMNGLKWRVKSALSASSELMWAATAKFNVRGELPEVTTVEAVDRSTVDSYWSEHTVNSKPFKTAYQSEKYLEWRSNVYPLFAEFMNLYSNHDNEVILDYGCGPGNDLVGFAIYTRARKIIGIDVSNKALDLARERLALHRVDPKRLKLIHAADSVPAVPLEDKSIDYIHCAGVLQHTSSPETLLKEFHRILKPGSRSCVMVYNRESVWLHLYTAYEKIILENAFPGLDAYEAFSKNVDGVECPLARCYTQGEFIAMCRAAGFQAEYVGGYFSDVELNSLSRYGSRAVQDTRLAEDHRTFLNSLVFDESGYPKYEGKHAGIGGVYYLHKE